MGKEECKETLKDAIEKIVVDKVEGLLKENEIKEIQGKNIDLHDLIEEIKLHPAFDNLVQYIAPVLVDIIKKEYLSEIVAIITKEHLSEIVDYVKKAIFNELK